MSPFDLSSLGDPEGWIFQKFSTELEKPDIQTLSLRKFSLENPIHMNFQIVQLNSKSLTTQNSKRFTLPISGAIGLEEQTEKEMENLPGYTFMFANFSEKGDLSLYALAQDKEDFLNFFGPKQVRLEVIDQDKDFDFGAREVRGDEAVRASVINFYGLCQICHSPYYNLKECALGK